MGLAPHLAGRHHQKVVRHRRGHARRLIGWRVPFAVHNHHNVVLHLTGAYELEGVGGLERQQRAHVEHELEFAEFGVYRVCALGVAAHVQTAAEAAPAAQLDAVAEKVEKFLEFRAAVFCSQQKAINKEAIRPKNAVVTAQAHSHAYVHLQAQAHKAGPMFKMSTEI